MKDNFSFTPKKKITFTEKSHMLSTSANSSGFHSEPRSDPSPPLTSHLSESCPTTGFFSHFSKDEGIDEDLVVPNRRENEVW